MKTALTNEGKILFFGQNIGQDYEFKPNNKFIQEKISFHFIVEKHIKDFECRLIKTPLSLITDEDAIELFDMMFSKQHSEKSRDFKIDIGKSWTNSFLSNADRFCPFNYIHAFQWLLSKGYALSYYCPIAKRIVTVEEQVEAGWITLKTN